ncbi:acetate/propionate family kinase [Actinomadura alba]|uniref:acetate/propionate family kinase n=1 Tax=Actinomadura alba TaxID=406431 RepID=UPI0028AEE1CC|nr:acetate kinase [Actinomadura alba]
MSDERDAPAASTADGGDGDGDGRAGRIPPGPDGGQVLVLNTGSSSIKYRLLEMEPVNRLAAGLVERIGEGESALTHHGLRDLRRAEPYRDHDEGLRAMLAAFDAAGPALDQVIAIGHRVVHGGRRFGAPVLIDDAVEQVIAELTSLAPLHNPANLRGIQVARRIFPGVPHVAVFDTAFHQTIPPWAHTYAVPREWAAEFGVRRYGFHGTSVAHVVRRASELLGRPLDRLNMIVLHLGNGASATAVEGGRSVDTSMGFTPLAGLVMGTRSGDVDPAVPAFLHRETGMTFDEIDTALNRRSGMLGLAGANDLRDVWRRVDAGDPDALLAVRVYCHRIRQYVGAYYAVLGRVDAVVFTAGVGENDARVRASALAGLDRLGITVDPIRNDPIRNDPIRNDPIRDDAAEGFVDGAANAGRVISPDGAEVAVLVIRTDEELEIATQTLGCVGRAGPDPRDLVARESRPPGRALGHDQPARPFS